MANSTQTYNSEKTTILFKRSCAYNEEATEGSVSEAVHEKILRYGEPMFLQRYDGENDILIIGDGILDKTADPVTITGRTVEEIISDGDFYITGKSPSLEKPSLKGPALEMSSDNTYPTSVTVEDSTDSTTKIATTAFVQSAITNQVSSIKTKTNCTSGIIYLTGVEVGTSEVSNTNPLKFCKTGTNNTDGVRIDCAKGVILGGAWNDFAEFRECRCKVPGTVVCEVGDGFVKESSKKLQAGASIISDTYGMIVGNNQPGYEPLCVAGRVLARYSGEKSKYKPGKAVCAGPNGKIMPMNRLETILYPDRILGYVSEIPEYTEWNNIEVNDRIWIKIK